MNEKKPTLNALGIVITAIAAVVGAIGGRMLVEQWMGKGPKDVDKALAQFAGEISGSLPMMVDPITRLDAVVAAPGKELFYRYTVLGVDPKGFDKAGFIQEKRPFLINSYKTTEAMKTLRENDVALYYMYQAEDGTSLAEIKISPRDF